MLKQYDFTMKIPKIEKVYSEITVKVHGALMYCIPQQDAERLHEQKYHAFSIYCIPADNYNTVQTRISSLHESCDVMPETASKLNFLIIKGAEKAEIIQKSELFSTSLKELLAQTSGRRYRLLFLTPSVFKTAGKETGFPDVTMHFLSVIRRMNEFEGEQIDFGIFRRAFYRCQFGEWQFRQYDYNVSGIHLPGLTGHADIVLSLDAGEQEMLKKNLFICVIQRNRRTDRHGHGGIFLLEALKFFTKALDKL